MAYSHRDDFPAPAVFAKKLYQPFTVDEWEASTFASDAELAWFRDARYGMFIHFGLSTYVNADLSWGVCQTRKPPEAGVGPVPESEWQRWPEAFRLEKFDAAEWVKIAQDAGFRYIVLITKHHDGFHMWDTAESDFKITNTPFGRDLVREVVDACHAAGMPVGLYYSQRDWYHPDYMPVDPEKVVQEGTSWTLKPGFEKPMGESHPKYLAYQEKVVRELCTNYGKIDIFWWDALWWDGMFTAEMWDAERITRLIRELQPGIIMNNRCCVPGDFDTPEGRLGYFQNWRPWESCICLTASWSYSGTEIKTLKRLVGMLVNNISGDGNLLLSWGPHWDGEFDAAERERLIEFGGWIKQHERALFGTRGGPWKPNNWGGSVYRGDTVFLHVNPLPGGRLELPALPGRSILGATLFDGTPLACPEEDGSIVFQIPAAQQDPLDTIIEITLDGPAGGIEPLSTGLQSLFVDRATYGERIQAGVTVTASSFADSQQADPGLLVVEGVDAPLVTMREPHPWVMLDLGQPRTVTGIQAAFCANRPGKRVALLVSADGEDWQSCGEVESPFSEVQVNGYRAGAWIPGLEARYLKLEAQQDQELMLDLKDLAVFATD